MMSSNGRFEMDVSKGQWVELEISVVSCSSVDWMQAGS